MDESHGVEWCIKSVSKYPHLNPIWSHLISLSQTTMISVFWGLRAHSHSALNSLGPSQMLLWPLFQGGITSGDIKGLANKKLLLLPTVANAAFQLQALERFMLECQQKPIPISNTVCVVLQRPQHPGCWAHSVKNPSCREKNEHERKLEN